jgi:hypothetical protein
MIELISVHLPKCAGTSLRQALERVYPADAIYYDYEDRPADPASAINLDPEGFLERHWAHPSLETTDKKVIHGHFYIKKYDNIKGCARIVFMRHPVERLIAHYYFWLSFARQGHTLHDYVLDNDISLLQFARIPFMRYFYTRVFFRDVDMKVFDFIGRYENMQQESRRLSRLIGKEIVLEHLNRNPHKAYVERHRKIMEDRKTVAALRESLAEDICLYERVTHLE